MTVKIFGRYGAKQGKYSPFYDAATRKCYREAEGFNTDVMKEAVADLQSAHKANNDLCASSFNPILPLDKPDGEAEISRDTLTTSVPDPSTAGVNEDDGIQDDDDGAPLRFPLRNTSQVNRELSIKKPAKKKPKEGDEISSKKGEVIKQSIKIKKSTMQQQTTGSKVPSPRNTKELAALSKEALSLEAERKQPHVEKTDNNLAARHEAGKPTKPAVHGEGSKQRAKYATAKQPGRQQQKLPSNAQSLEQKKGSATAYDKQEATDSRKPKLRKEVVPKKHDEKRLGATRTPKKAIECTENLPLAYCLLYVIWLIKLYNELSQDELTISKYVFSKLEDVDDSYGDKEAIGASMLTLKPGE
ncbi:hypothetical protein Cgig2_023945 [Carnegiea gigantea]|uniref:Uncharacterized protein n=1 Tax=Carnegiea gigantea TaxID=171969 RepID=A0A9Q1GHA0_9CARY|nr:hypothetical protein Cgig2_023945 [Carnegiea gigantea]